MQTELHVAAMQDNTAYLKHRKITAEELLQLCSGNTPLLWAIANSSLAFALDVLDFPDTTQVHTKSHSWSYNTPLILSVSKGWEHIASDAEEPIPQKAVAIKLIDKGAEVNAVDVLGRSALHYACLHRNLDAIDTLVRAGASWDIRDINDQTPLDLCCEGYISASRILDTVTGGEIDFTFTLDTLPFQQAADFNQHLVQVLSQSNITMDAHLLKQAQLYNQRVEQALEPLYEQAKKLFKLNEKRDSFEVYVDCLLLGEALPPISNPAVRALLQTYHDLKRAAALHLDYSELKLLEEGVSQALEAKVQAALHNPELQEQQALISEAAERLSQAVAQADTTMPKPKSNFRTGQTLFPEQHSSTTSPRVSTKKPEDPDADSSPPPQLE